MNFTNLRNSFKNTDNENVDIDTYLKELRLKNKYDPRKDIEEDSELWVKVLRQAENINNQVYSNLHGLRCAGCRLKIKDKQLTLIPNLDDYYKSNEQWLNDREEYLLPYAKDIKSIFEAVMN